MRDQILLVVSPPGTDAATIDGVGATARASELIVVSALPEEAIEEEARLERAGHRVVVALLLKEVERPIALARQLYRSRQPQILFEAGGERASALRKELSLAPMVGRYRLVADLGVELSALLGELTREAKRRRQTRTTLDRINARLTRPSVDASSYRRLVISDRYLASILEQAGDAILSLDDDGKIVTWNAGAEALFGVGTAEARSRLLGSLLGPDSASAVAVLLQAVRAGQAQARGEMWHTRRDGETLDLELSAASVLDETGRRIGFSVIGRDVTERKNAEVELAALVAREQAARAEAETANRLKDEFLATVSHELRTPLNAILGWARMLAAGRLDEETSRRGLETIVRNASAQAQLIEDILDISRIITGKLRLQVQSVELAPVVEAAVDSLRPAAQAKNIRLETILDTVVGPILGDAHRLQQVVWNLVSNAVKFTPASGRVRITLARVESHAEIEVTDTGAGISEAFLPYVFERFRQQDGTTTRQHGGLGLGLAIVRHLAELHGGRVEAESAGSGHGSAFRVKLPLMLTRPARGDTSRAPADPVGFAAFAPGKALDGVRIVIVDDEPDTCEIVELVLADAGAEIRAASNAADALELVRSWEPDLLISDVGMPGGDGYDLIRRVRALSSPSARHVPAIALTAFARQEDRIRLLGAGFQAHVSKPADPAELVAVAASQLRSSA